MTILYQAIAFDRATESTDEEEIKLTFVLPTISSDEIIVLDETVNWLMQRDDIKRYGYHLNNVNRETFLETHPHFVDQPIHNLAFKYLVYVSKHEDEQYPEYFKPAAVILEFIISIEE